MRCLLLVIALFGAGLRPACAANSPAQLVIGERSIEELLRIPASVKPGRYTIHCGVLIGTSGWALFVQCYSPTGTAPYELQKAVMYATKTSVFVAATRDGKRVEVFTTLTVVVDTSLGDPLLLAVLNNGADAARYGMLYTAPQRYGGSHISMPILRLHDPLRTAVVWMKLQIDEQGVMRDCTVINDADAPQWWVKGVPHSCAKDDVHSGISRRQTSADAFRPANALEILTARRSTARTALPTSRIPC